MEFKELIHFMLSINTPLVMIVFIPQIRLLLKEKDSKALSLSFFGLSFWVQAWGFADVALSGNVPHMALYGGSLLFLGFTIGLIIYYRIFPGGRGPKDGPKE